MSKGQVDIDDLLRDFTWQRFNWKNYLVNLLSSLAAAHGIRKLRGMCDDNEMLWLDYIAAKIPFFRSRQYTMLQEMLSAMDDAARNGFDEESESRNVFWHNRILSHMFPDGTEVRNGCTFITKPIYQVEVECDVNDEVITRHPEFLATSDDEAFDRILSAYLDQQNDEKWTIENVYRIVGNPISRVNLSNEFMQFAGELLQ